MSRPTIYRRIAAGDFHPIRVSSRTIRIPIEELTVSAPEPVSNGVDYTHLLTLDEALRKYKVSKSTLYLKMSDLNLKTKRIRFVTYFPEKALDEAFMPEEHIDLSIWTPAKELVEKHGISRKYVNDFANKHGVSRKKVGNKLYVNLKEWNDARFFKGEGDDYMTVSQATKLYHIGNERFYKTVNKAGIERYRSNREVYFSKKDLDRLFLKSKEDLIPSSIRKNYVTAKEALVYCHVGQKRFSAETQAAGIEKLRCCGFTWYKKTDLDRLFKK